MIMRGEITVRGSCSFAEDVCSVGVIYEFCDLINLHAVCVCMRSLCEHFTVFVCMCTYGCLVNGCV
jgi:hypothetical protein